MATAYRWNEAFAGEAIRRPEGARARKAESVISNGVRGVRNPSVSPQSLNRFEARPQILCHPRRTAIGKKPAMVEFHTLKRIDNSRLVRHLEPVKLRNLYKTLALSGVVALCCLLYAFQHFRCIDLSFQLEELKGKQVQAQSLNSGLRLEIETLRDPARIDVIAQKELGLKRPESAQVREYASVGGAEVAVLQHRSVVRSQ